MLFFFFVFFWSCDIWNVTFISMWYFFVDQKLISESVLKTWPCDRLTLQHFLVLDHKTSNIIVYTKLKFPLSTWPLFKKYVYNKYIQEIGIMKKNIKQKRSLFECACVRVCAWTCVCVIYIIKNKNPKSKNNSMIDEAILLKLRLTGHTHRKQVECTGVLDANLWDRMVISEAGLCPRFRKLPGAAFPVLWLVSCNQVKQEN